MDEIPFLRLPMVTKKKHQKKTRFGDISLGFYYPILQMKLSDLAKISVY